MGSRYGRNKRRADRARIQALEAQVWDLKVQRSRARDALWAAKAREEKAYTLAFETLSANSDYVKLIVERVADGLAAELGPKVKPLLDQILRKSGLDYGRSSVDVSALSMPIPEKLLQTVFIRGRIDPITYTIALLDFDLERHA